MTITRKTPLALLLASTTALRRVAIVTGGTRGVGLGISQALAENDFDLLLTYNSDSTAAEKAVLELKNQFPICAIETVGGDVSLPETRKAIFDKFDSAYVMQSSREKTPTRTSPRWRMARTALWLAWRNRTKRSNRSNRPTPPTHPHIPSVACTGRPALGFLVLGVTKWL